MLKDVIYIFADCETTGLSPEKERMTEIAMIRCDENFEVIDTFEMLINPERVITDKIVEITGITEEMVEDAPKYNEAIPQIHEWFNYNPENKQIIFVAHNAKFDIGFINQAGRDILGKEIVKDFIDTVSVARECFPYWKNHKLETCCKKFGVVNNQAHRAMSDTLALVAVGKRLISECIEDGFNPVNFLTKKSLHYKK
jgi:DNA polymerase-3 subunit alpha (Gram-positive type)